ncbi:hypothetical protein TNCV_5135621 [Trichonephila clavipes]|nr:hypothetical protein TNCV_5135621 [Trichonephila clavipes]
MGTGGGKGQSSFRVGLPPPPCEVASHAPERREHEGKDLMYFILREKKLFKDQLEILRIWRVFGSTTKEKCFEESDGSLKKSPGGMHFFDFFQV